MRSASSATVMTSVPATVTPAVWLPPTFTAARLLPMLATSQSSVQGQGSVIPSTSVMTKGWKRAACARASATDNSDAQRQVQVKGSAAAAAVAASGSSRAAVQRRAAASARLWTSSR